MSGLRGRQRNNGKRFGRLLAFALVGVMLLGAMPLIASDVSASLTDSFETNTGDFTHSSGWATYGISTDWAADGTHSLEMYERQVPPHTLMPAYQTPFRSSSRHATITVIPTATKRIS